MCNSHNTIKMAHGLFGLSVLAMILSAVVFYGGENIWGLAGTQWILISIALGVFAANLHACRNCGKDESC